MPENTDTPKARWYDYLAWGELPICDPVYGVLDGANITAPNAEAARPRKAPSIGLFASLRDRLLPRAPQS